MLPFPSALRADVPTVAVFVGMHYEDPTITMIKYDHLMISITRSGSRNTPTIARQVPGVLSASESSII